MNLIENKALQKYIIFNLAVTAIIGLLAWRVFDLVELREFKTWTIFFLLCGFLNCVITFSSFFVLKKKGIEVYTVKNMLIVTLAPVTNLLIPIWLFAGLSFNSKIGATLIIYLFTIVSFYAYHYGGKRLRNQIGLVTEEDRWEKEREKKEKEAKGK